MSALPRPAPTPLPSIVAAVREFVEREVVPVASELDHADRYPHALVARLRDLGLFGALVPPAYGGLGLDVTTYARVIEELCRGWMSLAGVINSHTMAALIVLHHGTDEQRQRFLPRFARGEARGGLCLTEPHAGSDVQAIRTVARREGDRYVLSGTKMFVTNGREGNTFALLALTEPRAEPRHRGMSCFVVEKGHPGLRVVKSISKLGYKGVDTAELVFEDFPVPVANLVGGVEGRGFKHVMSGLETGRINIAARAVGVAQVAVEGARHLAAGGAGSPAAGTPGASDALSALETKVTAARLLTYWAAAMKDRGERCDLEAGMAKLHASETAHEVAVAALRLAGERGQREPSPLERGYRDAPLMIIGEGTNEIQRLLIARNLLERYGERPGALTSPLDVRAAGRTGAGLHAPEASQREIEPGERRQMVLAVRRFVVKALVPVTAEHERADRHPAGILEGLRDLGLLGALVPQRYGGLELDLGMWAMIVEELGRGWATVASLVVSHLAAAHAVARFAPPAVRERLLPALTRGERWAAVARGATVTARREGRDLVLHGTTAPVANARRAVVLVVEARLEDGAAAVLLEGPVPGVSVGATEPTLGGRGLDEARVTLGSVRVDGAALLGGERTREEAAATVRAVAQLGDAATAVGVSQAAFEAALRYSQQRSAFGKPICQHQAVQLKLADMATWITAARLLTGDVADRLEAGEADGAAVGAARAYAADVALTATLESMRIHGGYGYTTEFPVERYYREAARLAVGGPDA